MPVMVLPALTTASPGRAGLVEVCRDDVNHDRVTHAGAADADDKNGDAHRGHAICAKASRVDANGR